MAQSFGVKSNADGSSFVYIEDSSGNSLAFGSDNMAQRFALNTSDGPNIIPDSLTGNIVFNPDANGNITFNPNGTGNSIFATGDVTLSAGNIDLPTTTSGFTAGVININNVRYFHAYNANESTSPNLFVGPNAGNDTLTTSDFNIGIGASALALLSTGDLNIGIGLGAGGKINSGNNNILIGGYSSSSDLTTGNQNTFIGFQAGALISSGDLNICIGYLAGDTLTTTDNNNICIGNRGTSGDVGTMRLGTPLTHTATYISGIYNNSPAGAEMVIVNTAGEMGSQSIPSGDITITGDTGGPLTNSSFTFTGGVANTGTLSFSGSGSTLSLLVQDANNNVIIGPGGHIPSPGGGNTVVGYIPFATGPVSTATLNQGFGYQCFNALTTGSRNSAFGQQPLLQLTTGNYNLSMGAFQSGVNYTSNETSNILIGSPGVTGDNNTIRIGDQGTGNAQQNSAYIAGVYGVSPSSPQMVTIASDGHLGSQAIPASGSLMLIQTQTTAGAATVDFTTGISSTYGTYMILFRGILASTGGPQFQMLFSTDGGSTWLNSGYQCGYTGASYSNVIWGNGNSTSLAPLGGLTTTIPYNGYMYIHNLAGSIVCTYNGQAFEGGSQQDLIFGYNSNTGINALRFQAQSGNIIGTISLYGIAQ